MDLNQVRIILFIRRDIYNETSKDLYCKFEGSNFQSKALLINYKAVHNSYYNLLCRAPTMKEHQSGVSIYSNKIKIYNNGNNHQRFNLLFCLTTLFSYDRTKRFIEFIEYYRNFGVDKFIIYNTNCSNNIMKLLRFYKSLGIMDIIFDNFTHNLYEKKRFHLWKHNDCFHRYKYYAKRIIYTDHDEIIYSSNYNNSVKLFSHLSKNAALYLFYPKLTITNGRGFFVSENYSICPNKLWKYIINKPYCISHLGIHHAIIKKNCFSESVPIRIAYVIHARNEGSYHVKKCKIWIYEKHKPIDRNTIVNRTKLIENIIDV